MEVVSLTGPGWVAANAAKEDLKSYFRGPISMELRQAGERVATKSVLWSYTAIRHFVSALVFPRRSLLFHGGNRPFCVTKRWYPEFMEAGV